MHCGLSASQRVQCCCLPCIMPPARSCKKEGCYHATTLHGPQARRMAVSSTMAPQRPTDRHPTESCVSGPLPVRRVPCVPTPQQPSQLASQPLARLQPAKPHARRYQAQEWRSGGTALVTAPPSSPRRPSSAPRPPGNGMRTAVG